jgi:AraC-like DNA-binding protein
MATRQHSPRARAKPTSPLPRSINKPTIPPTPSTTADAAEEGSPSWIASVRNSQLLNDITAQRPELPIWLLRWDGRGEIEWIDLADSQRGVRPVHFEIQFGKGHLREQHYRQAMLDVARTSNPVVRELLGVCDLFYPLPGDGRFSNALHIGQFYRRAPTWTSLRQHWSAVSDRDPAPTNPEFFNFVRTALALPVVDDAVLSVLFQLLEEYAHLLTGCDRDLAFHRRVRSLNRDAFSALWPIEDWVRDAMSPDCFHLTPWYRRERFDARMREGMGIARLPTTVMSLMPLDDRCAGMDPVETLVRNAQVQRACLTKVRDMPNTAACRLDDYGVSFVTSTGRDNPGAINLVELRERAADLCAFVFRELGVEVGIGIGESLSPGAGLYPSYRSSLRALRSCINSGKQIASYDECGSAPHIRYADLQRQIGAITDALREESSTRLRLEGDRYVSQVVAYADSRLEIIRGQLLATLFQLFKDIERRTPCDKDSRDLFIRDLSLPIETARSIEELGSSFRQAIHRMCYVAARVLEGPKLMRIELTLQHLQDNYSEHLTLPEVARKAGFSVPAFSRSFKKITGTSFLNYLRTLRVEHAKRLLTTSRLTTEEIAQACGFQSQHHLIRSFKKTLNDTPGAYRKAHTVN